MVFAGVLRCGRPILSPIYRRITDKRAAVTPQKQRVSGDCGVYAHHQNKFAIYFKLLILFKTCTYNLIAFNLHLFHLKGLHSHEKRVHLLTSRG